MTAGFAIKKWPVQNGTENALPSQAVQLEEHGLLRVKLPADRHTCFERRI
jgi:hypothetical protein